MNSLEDNKDTYEDIDEDNNTEYINNLSENFPNDEYFANQNCIDINYFLHGILIKFKNYNPKWFRDPDDLRIDRYYVSITQNIILQIEGICDELLNIDIYKNNDTNYDVTTTNGLKQLFLELDDENDNFEENLSTLFELDLEEMTQEKPKFIELLLLTENKINEFL